MKPLPSETVWAYSYMRFSSPQQADGDSLRRQNALREAWLKRNPNVRLDKSLTLTDPGVSALVGEHRKNPKHAMYLFLQLVQAKRVLPGSYLIVENLDRLSRENPIESMPFVLSLIQAGIQIVQLSPYECVYNLEMDQGRLIAMLAELSRGHGESKRKSDLVGNAWAEKKRLAREGIPIGKAIPGWLQLENGRYTVRPGTARIIRNIFLASARGKGYIALTKELNQQGIPCWTRSGKWTRGYVCQLLASRAVLGEYQPMKGHKRRIPDGSPVPGYFPAVITEAEWLAAKGARQVRSGKCGRPSKGKGPKTPFAGLLWSANDGSKLRVKKHKRRDYFITAKVHDGVSKELTPSFPAVPLVEALLSQLAELQAADLFSDAGAVQVQELQGKLTEVDGRLAVALERFEKSPSSAIWADRIDAYEKERTAILAELKDVQDRASNPVSAHWTEAVRLMRENEPERLRQCLLATIKEVWCLFCTRGLQRLAAVQVYFADGEANRSYLIHFGCKCGLGARKEPGKWVARSLREVASDGIDLRDREQADKLAKRLYASDWTGFSKR